MNQSISSGGVSRTAPATPGLLNIYLLNKHGKNKVLDVRFNCGDQAEPGSALHTML